MAATFNEPARREIVMYDSFSEGTVYYGRAFMVAFGAVILALVSLVL